MFCQHCGTQLEEGSTACPKCTTLAHPTLPPSIPAPGQVPLEYGFTCEPGPGRTRINVGARRQPITSTDYLSGCCVVFLVAFASFIGFVVQDNNRVGGAFKGAFYVLIPCLVLFFIDKSVKDRKFGPVLLEVTKDSLSINGAAYAIAHINEWAIRWKNGTTTQVIMMGQGLDSIGAALGAGMANSSARKQAEHSFQITFDYGNKRVVVAQGMTEPMATGLLDAIQSALAAR